MSIFRRYGLSLTLGALFLSSWVGQALVQWQEYAADQADHGASADAAGYWVVFGRSTLENWQSEFLQLLTFVVLTAFLIHQGSHESKDSSDRQAAKIDEILRRLDGGRTGA